MTESRDQRFFEGLNNAPRAEDPETPSGATTGPQPIETSPGASPAAQSQAPEGFAAQEDPAGGKHHSDPPGDGADVAPEPPSNWGQPLDRTGQSGPRADAEAGQPRPPRDGLSEADASPPGTLPRSFPQNLPQRAQTFAQNLAQPLSGAPETAGPGRPPREPAEGGDASAPPPPAGQEPSLSGHPRPPSPGPRPHNPVPPEERTQFISREALRDVLPPNTSPPPPPAWGQAPSAAERRDRPGGPRPNGGQRPAPPPGWPADGPQRPQPASDPQPGSGPRAPSWDWGTPSGSGTGGAELRGEQISASELNAPRKIASSRGWRKWLYYGTFKLINTGESPDEQVLRNLNATVGGHLRGTYSIVVLGGKGGVGKTTTTAAVGSTFASLRNDKTIAVDANPDRASNLADRIDPSATNSYKDVLTDPDLQRYSDIRSHVGQNAPAGLDVLGNRYQSDRQPLTAQVYSDTHDRLQRFYSVLISDSGTDVDHPVITGLMGRADALIMVASTAPDGAKGAAELMDWAYEAGYHRLLQRTVVVINDVRGDSKSHRKLVDTLVEKFSRWVTPQRVFVVPFDSHIASAGVIDLSELRADTRRRFLEITAKVATGFNSSEDRR